MSPEPPLIDAPFWSPAEREASVFEVIDGLDSLLG
jgi:hypothetical protein